MVLVVFGLVQMSMLHKDLYSFFQLLLQLVVVLVDLQTYLVLAVLVDNVFRISDGHSAGSGGSGTANQGFDGGDIGSNVQSGGGGGASANIGQSNSNSGAGGNGLASYYWFISNTCWWRWRLHKQIEVLVLAVLVVLAAVEMAVASVTNGGAGLVVLIALNNVVPTSVAVLLELLVEMVQVVILVL